MSRRVFVHVGSPGAGTVWLRRRLWANAASLEQAGILLPGHERRQASAARTRIRLTSDEDAALSEPGRAFPRLIRAADQWSGDVVIAHEALAAASVEQARWVRQALSDAEVHVVITSGPLSLALVAAWQEQLSSGIAGPLTRYAEGVRDHQRRGIGFWRVQDIPQIARRWGKDLAADQVHLLPYPATWHVDGDLWSRYCLVLGTDPGLHELLPDPLPPALGVVESALLLEIHAARDPRFTDKERQPWTRHLLVDQVLAQRPGVLPLAEPTDAGEWLVEETALMTRRLKADSYHVAGDLDMLRWAPPPAEARTLDSVTPKELTRASRWVISRLQEMWVERQPRARPPEVGAEDGIPGILELLEHIRAHDTGVAPRPAPSTKTSTTDRLKRSLAGRRTS